MTRFTFKFSGTVTRMGENAQLERSDLLRQLPDGADVQLIAQQDALPWGQLQEIKPITTVLAPAPVPGQKEQNDNT